MCMYYIYIYVYSLLFKATALRIEDFRVREAGWLLKLI